MIAISASLIALVQNRELLAVGLNGSVIIPLLLPCTVEIGLCWVGYSVVRNTGRHWAFLAAWCVGVIVIAGLLLPGSTITD